MKNKLNSRKQIIDCMLSTIKRMAKNNQRVRFNLVIKELK